MEEVRYQRLVHRSRGGRLAVSLLLRVLLAAAFLAPCGLVASHVVPQYGWAVGASGLPGRFEVHECHKDGIGLKKYQQTLCSGVLRAPDGRVVAPWAQVYGTNGLQAGRTSDVRYRSAGDIHRTGVRPMLQAVSASLFGLALAVGGIAALLFAFRRLSPAHPWFTRDARVRKWPSRLSTAGGMGLAAAGLAPYLISLVF